MLAICARFAIIRDFYDFKGYDSRKKKILQQRRLRKDLQPTRNFIAKC